MNSKSHILSAIKNIDIEETELPEKYAWTFAGDLLDSFSKALKSVGGEFIKCENFNSALETALSLIDEKSNSFNGFEFPLQTKWSPQEWNDLDFTIVSGKFGVAENGAVWVSEMDLPDRVLPFICKHLILLIPTDKMVSTMHEAYDKIQKDDYGYGVFISGPSKTADIEQSLVIGAHGPLAMTVISFDK